MQQYGAMDEWVFFGDGVDGKCGTGEGEEEEVEAEEKRRTEAEGGDGRRFGECREDGEGH